MSAFMASWQRRRPITSGYSLTGAAGFWRTTRRWRDPGALYRGDDFAPVLSLLETFEPCENARAHPYFEGPAPRTMLIDEVEAIWAPIAAKDDWSGFLSALDDIAAMRAAYAV